MDEESQEKLLFELLYHFLEKECLIGSTTAQKIASRFYNISEFVEYDFTELKDIESEGGKKLIRISDEKIIEITSAIKLGKLDVEKSVQENYLQSIGRVFVTTQIRNINNITLDILNPNPFLIKSLNLIDIAQMIEFLVFQRATRSIVTSFGFVFEKLLVAASATKLSRGFDVIKSLHGFEHYIQVKSGTSDMDKDQIIHWKSLIEEKEKEGHKAYIGMPYGKRDGGGMTLGLMRQYLPDWENRTLIGKELWDFISGNKDFHEVVLHSLSTAATCMLNDESILSYIEDATTRVLSEFNLKYKGNISTYVNSLF